MKMKPHTRLALPALASLTLETSIAFVVVDRDGRLARAGQLTLRELGEQTGTGPVYVIMQDGDAVVTSVVVPPVPAARLHAAVIGSIEPMLLSDVDTLCVAHGGRQPDGVVTVAWSARRQLQAAWLLLAEAGLNVVAFVPQQLALPEGDPEPGLSLTLPAGPRWLAPLPTWSLANDDLRPASGLGRWRQSLRWGVAAAVIWMLGLNGYAAQLNTQVKTVQQSMQKAVTRAFPEIPVIIDPVRQAQNQRDALRLAQGAAADDGFMAMAQATAQVLDFAQGQVQALHYDKGVLTLTLTEGYTPSANEADLAQAVSVRQLVLEKDPLQANVWQVRRPDAYRAEAAKS